jgi:predicted  nucleic acid-binding Zn-ribbon protein
VRYYKALKEFDTETAICTMIDDKTTELESRTALAKEQIAKLEDLLDEAKQKKKDNVRAAREYIDTARKTKEMEDSRLLPELAGSA